jgi:hypothetical protein
MGSLLVWNNAFFIFLRLKRREAAVGGACLGLIPAPPRPAGRSAVAMIRGGDQGPAQIWLVPDRSDHSGPIVRQRLASCLMITDSCSRIRVAGDHRRS